MSDGYQIEPDGFEVPSLPGGVNVGADAEDAQERLGRDLLVIAKQVVGKRDPTQIEVDNFIKRMAKVMFMRYNQRFNSAQESFETRFKIEF